jgi:tetratricopeptide (TPR) repeat protein
MKMRYQAAAFAALLPILVVGTGCNTVRSKAAFKDGNRLYKEANWRKAIEMYEKALSFDPNMAEAHFYLASSHQALYRPGKDDPENKARLDQAIEHYQKAIEVNKSDTPNAEKVRLNALGALTAIYSEPPYQDYEKALSYAQELVSKNPNDSKNLYAIANLYEKFGKIQEAEETYKKVAELNPSDTKACGALAAFYNKPLWDESGAVWADTSKGGRRAKFDLAIATLDRCANLDPADCSGHYKVATFYWDKAYRDPMLGDAQKETYASAGLEAVDKALQCKPDYWEAIITKGLLFRVKAANAKNPKERLDYLERAQTLQKQAMELRKEQQASPGAAAAAASPVPDVPAPTDDPAPTQ